MPIRYQASMLDMKTLRCFPGNHALYATSILTRDEVNCVCSTREQHEPIFSEDCPRFHGRSRPHVLGKCTWLVSCRMLQRRWHKRRLSPGVVLRDRIYPRRVAVAWVQVHQADARRSDRRALSRLRGVGRSSALHLLAVQGALIMIFRQRRSQLPQLNMTRLSQNRRF